MSNVLATSDMIPRLVELYAVGRLKLVDMVSWLEFQTTPKALEKLRSVNQLDPR